MSGVIFDKKSGERIASAVRAVEGEPIDTRGEARNRKSRGGAGSPYTLFEIVKDGDTAIVVQGYNVTAGRYSRNYCIFGLSRVELADAASVTGITVTGVIYLEAAYSSGWTVTAKFAAVLPAQDTTHLYHSLADVVCADSKITNIFQPPTGIIHFPMRAG